MSLSTQDRITKTHIWLMSNPSTMHYSGIIMIGDVRITEDVPTAATDGCNVMYNPHFVNSLTDPQLRGLCLHEANHKCFQHLYVWQDLWKQDAKLANMATDYVNNLMIYDLDPSGREIALPPHPCLDQQYRDMDSGQVFDLLKHNPPTGCAGHTDSHLWEDAQALPEEEKQALSKEIDNAVRQGAFMAGKLNGQVSRGFNALMEPKLDWRELLRDYVSSVCVGKGTSTWARPNRRYLSMDLYLPSQISEAIGGIAIVVDTSGSVNAELLTKFMAEIIGIAENTQPEALHLICCDGDVASHDIYMQDNYHALAAVREFKGGGGTDMRKALDYIEEHKLNVEVVVILTDGYTPYPDRLSKPVLWAMTEKHMTAPIGSTIHLN